MDESARPAGSEPDKDAELRKMAEFEYDQSRRGVEKYDDHLFRIRQWNIGLSAAALAALLGFVESKAGDLPHTGGANAFSPSLALFVFTSITLAFWLLDGLNKSLQTVHIHNNRDIEKYLRGATSNYVGPTISLRFHRKHKRHWVGTVKNLTDESVIWFYLFPIVIFWVAIIRKFRPDIGFDPSLGGVGVFFSLAGEAIDRNRAATASLVLVGGLLFLSYLWKHGPRTSAWFPWSKFFFRPKAARRRRAYVETFLRLHELARLTDVAGRTDSKIQYRTTPCDCLDKGDLCKCSIRFGSHFASPFRADFYNEDTRALLFIDRKKLARSPIYLHERQQYFSGLEPEMTAVHVDWYRPRRRWIPLALRRRLPIRLRKRLPYRMPGLRRPWRPRRLSDRILLEFLGRSTFGRIPPARPCWRHWGDRLALVRQWLRKTFVPRRRRYRAVNDIAAPPPGARTASLLEQSHGG